MDILLDIVHSVDYGVLAYISEHWRGGLSDTVWKVFSLLGSYGAVWITLAVLLLFFRRTRRAGAAMLIALGVGFLLGNVFLKNLVMRPRPFVTHTDLTALLVPEDPWSFPSGHTLSSFAAASALYFFHHKTGFLAFLLAAAIAFSRLYASVHYPTDVLTGAVIGVLCGIIAAWLTDRVTDQVPHTPAEKGQKMNQYKRLLGNTFIFAIGTFSSKILVILMLRFYTGMMTQDEMGVADLIIKTTSILYPVVSLSIGQAVIRYGLERKYYKRSVFTIALVTVLCGFIIALPFHPLLSLIHYNTSAGVTGSLLEYQWIIYLYVLTSCTQNVCSQFIRALGHVRLYAIDGIFRTFVTIMLNILYLKVFRWNILGYVFSIICSDALSTVCLFIIASLWKYVKLKRLDMHLWRGMLAYSLPLVPDAILVYIIGFSDQVFLASMQDTAVSAIYSIAYRVPTLIALVASIFVDAWQISMVNNNTKEEQITFFSNVGNTYSSIVFIIASGGVMCAKLAMTVLAVPSYYIGWTFIPILAVGAGFNCLSSFQKSVYLLEKKTVASFLSTAFSAVINIGLNALLIPRMGGTGAALATLISYVALFLYRAIDSRRFMPVRWKVPRLTLTVILLAVQSVLMLLEPPLWLVWQIALFGAVAALNSREMLLSVKKLLHRA